MSILSIGVSGINAAQLGLMTTEHNITNANTPGFNRQSVVQTTNFAVFTGSGFVGQGAHVETIKRGYSQFVVNQLNQSQTAASELDTLHAQIRQIDNLLADPNAGLSPALQGFFDGVQEVAGDPASLPARQVMVSSAQGLAGRFQSIEQRLASLRQGLNDQVTSTVSTINSFAEQIAQINDRIVVAAAGQQQPPNDLLDQRDQLIAELNTQIRVTTTQNTNGSYNVFIGNGQQLVVGGETFALMARPSAEDPERLAVALKSGPGFQEMPDALLSGGALSGLLRFRSEALEPTAAAFGRVAASLALSFNAQHGLGQDLLGARAGDTGFVADFFKLSDPATIQNTSNTGTASVGASFTPAPLLLNGDAFALTLSAGIYSVQRLQDGAVRSGPDLEQLLVDAKTDFGVALDLPNGHFGTELTGSDYRVSFNAANAYTITRLSDSALVASGTAPGTVSVDGLEIAIGGAPNSGDSFLIRSTREAARNLTVDTAILADARLIAAGQPVRAAARPTNTGTAAISSPSLAPGATTSGLPFTLSFNAGVLSGFPPGEAVTVTEGNGTVTNYPPPASVNYASDAVITVAGMSFKISGPAANGDQFVVEANTGGVGDGRNALLLGRLQTQKTTDGGAASFQSAYAQLVGKVGTQTREIGVNRDAQTALAEQSAAARESLAGVNLDEEAANLLRYQQAYQAAARIIDVGSKLFDVVLSLGR